MERRLPDEAKKIMNSPPRLRRLVDGVSGILERRWVTQEGLDQLVWEGDLRQSSVILRELVALYLEREEISDDP